MTDNDSSKLEKLYLENIIQEVNINSDVDFGGEGAGKFGRHKGRHFTKPDLKPHIPKSREEYTPKSEEEYAGSEYPEIFNTDEEPEDESVPEIHHDQMMDKEESRYAAHLMSSLRSEIDELSEESRKIKALSTNRELMDKIVSDLVLGFAKGKGVRLTHIADNDDPIFTIRDENGIINIQVHIPFGKHSGHEDIKYKKVTI